MSAPALMVLCLKLNREHVIAVDSTAETEIITHATGRKRLRRYCSTEHDNGQEEHRFAHAAGLLFDALIELDRDRSCASGFFVGSRIEAGHTLSPLLSANDLF